MRDTLITIQRPEGTTLTVGGIAAQHIRVQVDQVSLKEQLDAREAYRAHAGDIFKVYTLDWQPNFLIRRQDILLDELYTDPDGPTGNTGYKYRVIGRPKDYLYDHQECYIEVVVGG